MNRFFTRESLKQFIIMTLSTALVAVGIYLFRFPNHFSIGGVSGLSIVLGKVIPAEFLTPGAINTILTVAFLVLGFLFLDKSFGLKTVYCSLLYSFLIQLLEWVFPMPGPFTDEKMLELFFAVLLPSLGSAILFNMDASTGGSEIVAMIVKKYTGLNVGSALLLSDVAIAAAALWVFDVEAGLFSLMGLMLKSVLVDTTIESLNRRKSFTVVTHDKELVCRYINEELHRGATVWQAQGAYTHQDQYVVLTALSRHQAVLLRNYLKRVDPHAFMLITNSSEIFGKGFLQV